MKLTKDIPQIFILTIGLGLVVFFMYFFRFDKNAQLITGAVGCIYYTVWGIIHHALKERLSMAIFFEYVLFGLVVFLLLLLSFTL